MRLTVYAAFGKKHIFLRFGYNSSHNYTSVAKIYSYWVYLLCETLFLLRNYRLNRGFEVSYIFNFDEEQNNIK